MELRNEIEEIDEMEEIKDNKIIEYAKNNVISINRKKKKGFTLVELIAVIAILAILGAIIVPQIFGYMSKADRSKVQTDATIVLSAVQAYNADNSGATISVLDDASITKLGTDAVVPLHLKGVTVANLIIIASGSSVNPGFTVTKKAGVYTITMVTS